MAHQPLPSLLALIASNASSGHARYGRPGSRYATADELYASQRDHCEDQEILGFAHYLANAYDLDDVGLGRHIDIETSTAVDAMGAPQSVLTVGITLAGVRRIALRTGLYLPGAIAVTPPGTDLQLIAATATCYTRVDPGAWVSVQAEAHYADSVVRDPSGHPTPLWSVAGAVRGLIADTAEVRVILRALSPLLDDLPVLPGRNTLNLDPATVAEFDAAIAAQESRASPQPG